MKNESYFVWWYTEAMATDVKYFPDQDWDKREYSLKPRTAAMKGSGRDLAAFTVAELGEMLPMKIDDLHWLKEEKGAAGFSVSYNYCVGDGTHHMAVEKTSASEADARAKMLIYLVENKLSNADISAAVT
jgi:hypothetical protein